MKEKKFQYFAMLLEGNTYRLGSISYVKGRAQRVPKDVYDYLKRHHFRNFRLWEQVEGEVPEATPTPPAPKKAKAPAKKQESTKKVTEEKPEQVELTEEEKKILETRTARHKEIASMEVEGEIMTPASLPKEPKVEEEKEKLDEAVKLAEETVAAPPPVKRKSKKKK